jgi:integrase
VKLFKKKGSKLIWCDFRSGGMRFRLSTKQTKKELAGTVAAALLTRAEQGDSPVKKRAPLLRDYAPIFTGLVNGSIETKTQKYYASGIKLLLSSPLAGMPLNRIDNQAVSAMVFGGSPSNVNMARRTLRRLLSVAAEGQIIQSVPRIKLAKEYGRDLLIDGDAEKKLMAGPESLAEVLLCVVDGGMRPGEVVRMRCEYVRGELGHYHNPRGKTKNARRKIVLSERMALLLQRKMHGRREGWIFDSPRGGHWSLSAIERQFRETKRLVGLPEKMVMYCGRHSWATDVGREVGTAELMASGGWGDAKTAMGYQHPGAARIADAVNRRNESRLVN